MPNPDPTLESDLSHLTYIASELNHLRRYVHANPSIECLIRPGMTDVYSSLYEAEAHLKSVVQDVEFEMKKREPFNPFKE